MDVIQKWDEQVVLAVNGWHTNAADTAMALLTQTAFWTPLFLLIIYFLFKKFETRDAWLVLAAVAVAVLLTDQITSSFMKPFFARLRPSHHPTLSDQLHFVNNYRGGLYGFASSHAANSFGMAMVLFLLARQKLAGITWLFLWAGLMSFSRLYLGVHYLTDLLVGGLVGLVCGWVGYRVVLLLKKKLSGPGAEAAHPR